jgi:hypothetical protein
MSNLPAVYRIPDSELDLSDLVEIQAEACLVRLGWLIPKLVEAAAPHPALTQGSVSAEFAARNLLRQVKTLILQAGDLRHQLG